MTVEPSVMESPPCTLCGGERFSPVARGLQDRRHPLPGSFDVVACADCGLVQTRPRPRAAAIGRWYPAAYVSYGGSDGTPQRRPLVRAAARWLRVASYALHGALRRPPDRFPSPAGGNRLLDVGAGGGFYVGAMRDRGWEVRAVEPDPIAAERAAAGAGLGRGAIVVGTVEDADFAPGSFDLITMSHVVEHLYDPVGALRRMREWLAPGGRLMLWCPNAGSAEARLFGRHWDGLDPPRHLSHFTPRTLTRVLAEAGWEVERIVGEQQASSLAASLLHVFRAVTRSRAPFHLPALLLHAAEPLAGAALALGDMPSMQVTARPRPDR
jgi:2-polyprenyl-3-methyl-5-hydroxy-6-metoxy-1,4-benzoquinol methylase